LRAKLYRDLVGKGAGTALKYPTLYLVVELF